ncbi:hypothetical protein TNCV_1352671 [Trichonephila clavipes]|nr:hypothetical protein TNCV_1352671 [Trichonephila clavipes]
MDLPPHTSTLNMPVSKAVRHPEECWSERSKLPNFNLKTHLITSEFLMLLISPPALYGSDTRLICRQLKRPVVGVVW